MIQGYPEWITNTPLFPTGLYIPLVPTDLGNEHFRRLPHVRFYPDVQTDGITVMPFQECRVTSPQSPDSPRLAATFTPVSPLFR